MKLLTIAVFFIQTKSDDANGEIAQKKHDLVCELHQAIDDLSNLKTLRQLEKETLRAKEVSVDLEKRAEIHEYRVKQAQQRMQQIEDEDKERCIKTAALLKEFEKNSTSGPFFESLLSILVNYQGKYI